MIETEHTTTTCSIDLQKMQVHPALGVEVDVGHSCESLEKTVDGAMSARNVIRG